MLYSTLSDYRIVFFQINIYLIKATLIYIDRCPEMIDVNITVFYQSGHQPSLTSTGPDSVLVTSVQFKDLDWAISWNQEHVSISRSDKRYVPRN